MDGAQCLCPTKIQTAHYATVAQPPEHPDFDQGNLEAAMEWMNTFLEENRGVDLNAHDHFSAEQVV